MSAHLDYYIYIYIYIYITEQNRYPLSTYFFVYPFEK